jgi:hypothetical protein
MRLLMQMRSYYLHETHLDKSETLFRKRNDSVRCARHWLAHSPSFSPRAISYSIEQVLVSWRDPSRFASEYALRKRTPKEGF